MVLNEYNSADKNDTPCGMPLISVIVPIYQIDRYLGICIESLMNQTYKNLEIILVDDGSPDRCPEICDLYARKDRRIKVIHKQNGGLVSARKAGLERATGEYVGYVDGDDWIGPGFYDALYFSMATSKADIVCAGQSRDIFNHSVHLCDNYPPGIYTNGKLKKLKQNMLSCGEFYRPGITTYVWNKLFRRENLFRDQMNVDNRISIGEDAAVSYPAIMSCKSICVTDCVAYHYRQREDSMLKKSAGFGREIEKLKFLYEYMSSFANEFSSEFRLQKQIDDYVLSICIVRSGGRLFNDSFSTFDEKYYGKNIVIYSAGTFGQQLMKRFHESRHCNVVGWLDDDYWEYRRCCLDVDAVESITRIKYDYVLVATVDCYIAEKIKNRLLDFGISENRILTVNCPEQIRKKLIYQYLYSEGGTNE